MYDADKDNFDIFNFYKRLPSHEQKECEIFITPEKIYLLNHSDLAAENELTRKIEHIRKMTSTELRDSIESRGEWPYYTMFNRVTAAIKEYIQLRPAVIDKYPEFLIWNIKKMTT